MQLGCRGDADLVKHVVDFERQAQWMSHVGDGGENGLANPPHRVRNKTDFLSRVEPFGSFHKPEISFVDKIQKRNSELPVSFGDFYHKLEVGFDELLER